MSGPFITDEMIEAGAMAIAPDVWAVDPATFGHPDSLNRRGHELCKSKVRAQAAACLAAGLRHCQAPSDGAIYASVSRRDAMKDVLDFLESIGGAGYGGMADYEIARSIVRMEVEGLVEWAGITPAGTEASLDHPNQEPMPTVPASPSASASGPIQSWTGSASQSQRVQQAGSGSARGALSTLSGTNEP